MIIRFLKSYNSSAFVLLPLIAIVIWAFGFIHPLVYDAKHAMPLFQMTNAPLSKLPWVATFVALLLVVLGAFVLNYIMNENEVLTKQSFLPALFYILFMSNNNAMLLLHPALFSNIFVLFAINKVLSSYRKDLAFSQMFDAGLLISIATLFYFPSIVFLPLLGIAMIIFRTFNWREWMISFIGVCVPYAFVITYYFWNGTLDYLLYDKMFFPIVFKRPTVELSQSFYFMISIGWLIVILSFGKLFSGLGGGSQKTKKAMILVVWMFVLAGLSIFLAPELSTKFFGPLAIPTTVICSNYFLRQKKELWGEILFLILVVSIFVNMFSTFF